MAGLFRAMVGGGGGISQSDRFGENKCAGGREEQIRIKPGSLLLMLQPMFTGKLHKTAPGHA